MLPNFMWIAESVGVESHLQLICDLHIVTTDQKSNRSHLESYIYIMLCVEE